jgi:hypothetical protein
MTDCESQVWREVRRALKPLCLGPDTDALIERLCGAADAASQEALDEAIATWRQAVLADLEARIRLAKQGDGSGNARLQWLECLPPLFSFERRLVAKIRQCVAALRNAPDRERVEDIFWGACKQYFFDAWIELSPSPHRRRNWHKIQREIGRIRRDWQQAAASATGAERAARLASMSDCAALAEELLARSEDEAHGFFISDVSTLEGVLSYLNEFLPECVASGADIEWYGHLPNPIAVREALEHCAREVSLPPRQMQALQDALLREREPDMTAPERKQHRKALHAALAKLRPCLLRYVDDGGGDDQG